jgi:uncharacterized protein (TIGR02678 family)
MTDGEDLLVEDEDKDDPLAELTPVISALLRKPFLTEEAEPDLYRRAHLYESDLRHWFQATLGWRIKISTFGRYVRLFKRRDRPPTDRSPVASEHAGRPSKLALILLCLAAEQLWRSPEITFGDLQREVIRICAAESGRNGLPAFNVVTQAGESRALAEQHRRAFVDALELLQEWRVITCDGPLAATANDVVITCNPERLNDLLAAPAISQLQIDIGQPHTHVSKLCEDQRDLPEHAAESQRDLQRRHRALRAVIDDAVVVPDGDRGVARYMASPSGRRRALNAALTAGLTCIVRRDLWLTADPDRSSTDLEFPQPRSLTGQAALLLVDWLNTAESTAVLPADAFEAIIDRAKADNAEWARSYRSPTALRNLTAEAIAILVAAGVLIPSDDRPRQWTATGAHAYWRVQVTASDQHDEPPLLDESLFDQPEADSVQPQ